MTRKLIYAAGLVLTISATSCKKYLDIVPVGQVIPTTVEDFKKELNAAYGVADFDKGITTWRSDEVKMNETRSSDVERVKNHYLWDENGINNSVTYSWQKKYQVVFYTNHIIATVPGIEGKDADKDQLTGEACLLRAYTYFNLVNLYGNAYNTATMATDKAVPLITKVDMEQVSGRNTVKEIYEQITADIEKGLSLVNRESFEAADSYKFSKTAGHALAARVYLYTRQWDKALAEAKAVLQVKNTLVDFNSATPVMPTLYNSPESILAYELINAAATTQPAFASDKLIALYDATGDLRPKRFYGKDAKGNNTIVKVQYNNNYRQSFRVAEMYLIAAEAAAQLQQSAVAHDYLNQLKKKRLTPAFYATEESRIATLFGNALLNEIYDERLRELSFEGHRWFDLRRTTQPALTHTLQGKVYTLQPGDARYTIRIPKDAIASNPLLNE